MYWFDPNDPRSIAGIVTGAWCDQLPDVPYVDGGLPGDPLPQPILSEEEETAILALEVASDILFRLSGYAIHPAGVAEDDYRCVPLTHRLTPTIRPIRSVIDIVRLTDGCELDLVTDEVCVFGQDVYFSKLRCGLAAWYMDVCSCQPLNQELLRMQYRFSSTINASAQRAVLYLAHQFWLECNPTAGECQLPERTTSVNREGLSYTIFDPQTYLQQGKTGLPSVDLWLSTVNSGKALRPAGIWTPDAAPGVNTSVVWDWSRSEVPV